MNYKNVDIYLANLAAGNVKLHNLHWNVKGFAFKQVHEYLEFLYDDVFEKYDAIAELQKMQGCYPKASLKEYVKLTTVKELDDKDYSTKEAIELAREFLCTMKELALKIREEADEEDNFPLANMMEDHIESYNKQCWFMDSMLG